MVVSLDLQPEGSDSASRRTLQSLSLAVAKSKKIVVVTGAGISCSCGIPDFRSSDGLYNLVKKQYPNVVMKGRDLFDASLFRDPASTSVFYTFISQLKQSIDVASPSPTHHFIKTLDTKKKLLRSYTQNIDGLEERAGLAGSSSEEVRTSGKGKSKLRVKDVRNVQLHGDIHRVRCTFCSVDLPCTEEYLRLFDEGLPPDCPECTLRSEARLARAARPLKIGTLRPAIVLYDEAHPLGDDIGCIQSADVSRKPDMLIIMGTSLKVHGLRKLVKEFARSVHASAPFHDPSSNKPPTRKDAYKVVFVNKTPPGSEWNGIIDYHVVGETDEWAGMVLRDWRKAIPGDFEVQQTLEEAVEDTGDAFRLVKDVSGGKGTNTKKVARGMENIPPPIEDCAAPPHKPCSSPSKRRTSTSHYADGECSPSKKQATKGKSVKSVRSKIPADERGLLFGDATNNLEEGSPNEDPPMKTVTSKRSKSTLKRVKSVVEVVMPPRPTSRAHRRARKDVIVDVVD